MSPAPARALATTRSSPPQTIRLRDGRKLAYAAYGDTEGTPVFHFHGHPGSRLEGKLADSAARRLGVRLIAVDRPGMGYSDFHPRRQLLDWPDTVLEVADALGIQRFAVQGVSGGGPYALACAFKIPDRLRACGVVAGLGPIHELGLNGMMLVNRLQFTVARRAPWFLRPLFWAHLGRYRRRLRDPESFDRLVVQLSKGITKLTGSRELAEAYVMETLEAFRQGTKGPAFDARLYVRPWGFRLEDIKLPTVYLWHGQRDVHVPITMARAVSESIPNCQARFFPAEDHLTLILQHLDEVLETMRNPKAAHT
ncbi:MAG: alpha/beta hydrolase [Gammaproteobacteria bacterium]